MSFIVHIRPEAETDLEEAALWYEKQSPRLGDEFLDEVQGIFEIFYRYQRRYLDFDLNMD